jgi:hypothetical protein
MNKPLPRLRPARPDTREDSAGYLPRVSWRFVLLGTLALVMVGGGYYFKEQRKALQLRAAIAHVHEVELAEPRAAYRKLRNQLEGLISSAASAPLSDSVDRRLHFPALRTGTGLYLRLPLAAANAKPEIAAAAKAMEPDLIARCLGLAPDSAGDLYENGEFLLPGFIAGVKEQTSVMKLRVLDDMLSRHIRVDLPNVRAALQATWFMLILQEGDNRRDKPVRAFVWDLAHGDLLLRARVRSQGVLVTSRILSQGLDPHAEPSGGDRSAGAANDCSIAAELRRLTINN